MTPKRKIVEPVEQGSGNVFADLGFPDAAERKARADRNLSITSDERLALSKAIDHFDPDTYIGEHLRTLEEKL